VKNNKFYRIIIFILTVSFVLTHTISAYAVAYLKIERSGVSVISPPDFAEFNRDVFLQTDDTVSFGSIDPTAAGERQAAEIWKIVSKYSAAGKFIIEQAAVSYKTGAVETIAKWLAGSGPESLFMNMSFAAHEEYHFFQHSVSPERAEIGVFNAGRQMAGEKIVCVPFINFLPVTTIVRTVDPSSVANPPTFDVESIIIKPGENLLGLAVPETGADDGASIVITGRAAAGIPAYLRTFRWEMYVSPDSVLDSNIKGAYGLLNEFSAYYYGYKTAADCHMYVADYLTENGYQKELAFGYLASVSDALSFYEFKFWTLEYLIFLQNENPAQFGDLLKNGPFVSNFIYFHDRFEELVETTIPGTYRIIMDILNASGIDSWEDDEAVWIGKNGVGKQTDTIALLKGRMDLPEYTNMMNILRNAYYYN